MTITLAAVYAPIGLQGGLTGALFREFAFTLAGAVIVSGVVALTLSPMMGSRLLRAGDAERGFAGMGQPPVRRRPPRATRGMLAGTLAYRPVVLVLWAIVVVLMVPFYMFSQKELAPQEDQGVVFGDHPGRAERHARPDQAVRARRSTTSTASFPETESIFQITMPDRRLRRDGRPSPGASANEAPRSSRWSRAAGFSKIPGVRVIPLVPPALPGGGDFPVDFVVASTAEPQRSPSSRASSSGRRSRAACSCSPTRT